MRVHILWKLLFVLLCSPVVLARSLNVTQSEVAQRPSPRIVGGLNAVEGQIPYQVSLHVNGNHYCGGSIVDERFVVTAAHCVIDTKPCAIRIRAGSIWVNSGGQFVGVSAVRIHPGFHPGNLEELSNINNDIAVLKLSHPLEFNNYVKPIALANLDAPSGAPVLISGWGLLWEYGPSFPILQYNTVMALSNVECRAQVGPVPPSILCLAHSANNGACYGDSGGPAVYADRLVGVANFIDGCGTNTPDGYANVAIHVNWILFNMSY